MNAVDILTGETVNVESIGESWLTSTDGEQLPLWRYEVQE